LWASNGFHPIFIYIPIKVQTLFTLLKPCVMFLLTSCLYSFNYFSYGDVICGTSCLCSLYYPSCGDVICGTSGLCSLYYPSCGDVICGTFVVCLVAYTTVGTAHTTISTAHTIISTAHTTLSTAYGSTLPFIIFYALAFVLSYSFFTIELKGPPS
jgi:hypothetical protein